MGLSVGIVGLPNAGKSTLFNALTRAGAQVGNYPFTTIEPNTGVVPVPDERLQRLAELFRLTRAEQTWLLGAAQGEGLLVAQGKRVPFQVVATAEEARLIASATTS